MILLCADECLLMFSEPYPTALVESPKQYLELTFTLQQSFHEQHSAVDEVLAVRRRRQKEAELPFQEVTRMRSQETGWRAGGHLQEERLLR